MNNVKDLKNKDNVLTSILDSKLITTTLSTIDLYDVKLVDCGNYVQVYYYELKKSRSKKKDKSDLLLKDIKLDNFVNDDNNVNLNISNDNKVIENRNIIRSKLECQRIAKANINDWKTFITLTFEENLTDVKIANKRFNMFVSKIRRIKKDFKYLCITEFQKRGAIHYHMLCNIDYNDKDLLYVQEDNKKYFHIKYWLDGFTSVEKVKGDCKKIVGYIAKYMTKDIDNRLFNHRRYFYSNNCNKPIDNYINFDNNLDKDFYNKKIQKKELVYQNEYINPYDNTRVIFLEYFKNN